MPAIPYVVDGIQFETQRALANYVSHLLASHCAPYCLSPDETRFMSDLLTRHPSADIKMGCGVHSIWIRKNGMFGNGFYVHRVDGTWEDFSYRQCLRPQTYESKCKFAFRRAIDSQVFAAKRAVFPYDDVVLVCPITGKDMIWETAHVDHEPPLRFSYLLQTWLELHNLAYSDIPLCDPPDGIGKVLPTHIADQWAAWHAEHAVLRVISAEANLLIVR